MLGYGDFEKTYICSDCDRPFGVVSGFQSQISIYAANYRAPKNFFFKNLGFLT